MDSCNDETDSCLVIQAGIYDDFVGQALEKDVLLSTLDKHRSKGIIPLERALKRVQNLMSCPYCTYTSDRTNNMRRHISHMHKDFGTMFQCCGLMFRTRFAQLHHNKTFHMCSLYPCPDRRCKVRKVSFASETELKSHMKTEHNSNTKWNCEYCDQSFSTTASMDRHKEIMHCF